jgi:hypothetical protein
VYPGDPAGLHSTAWRLIWPSSATSTRAAEGQIGIARPHIGPVDGKVAGADAFVVKAEPAGNLLATLLALTASRPHGRKMTEEVGDDGLARK